MMLRTRSLESSSSRSKGPKLALSGGILKLWSQVPLAYAKKSSPGFTFLSPALRSRPKSPIAGFGTAGGATVAAMVGVGARGAGTGVFSSGVFDAQAAKANSAATQHTSLIQLRPSNVTAGAHDTAAPRQWRSTDRHGPPREVPAARFVGKIHSAQRGAAASSR